IRISEESREAGREEKRIRKPGNQEKRVIGGFDAISRSSEFIDRLLGRFFSSLVLGYENPSCFLGSIFSGFLVSEFPLPFLLSCVPERSSLTKEFLRAFEEALVQRCVVFTAESSELFQLLALFAVEVTRHFDQDARIKIAAVATVNMNYAFAA